MVFFYCPERGYMNVFSVVKDNVTAKQVAIQYGMKINRNGLACCPFHSDKTASMKIDKRYYCFGCGETGDAIDLVAKYFGLAPKEAAMKIAASFGLNFDATNRAPPKRVVPQKSKEQILDEELHPCFVETLQNISKVEYQMDTLLKKDISDRAFVISDIGKGVKSIVRRIEEYRRSERDAGLHTTRKCKTECR